MVSTQFSREANNVHRRNDGSRCYCNPKFIKFSALVLLSLPFPFLIHHLSSSSTSNKTIKLTIVRTGILDETGAMARQFEGEMGSLELFNDSIALAENEAENDKGGGGECGVPAMLAVFATSRLLYPSQAFDFIPCTRCQINVILSTVSLFGYQNQYMEMERFELSNGKEGYIAMWRKPVNNTCYASHGAGVQPPICDSDDDPENVWSEPFDTYTRTYDQLHATGLFSVEWKRVLPAWNFLVATMPHSEPEAQQASFRVLTATAYSYIPETIIDICKCLNTLKLT
ncbi:hypothetical protein KPL70_016093 [Citrus sinensis]|nr:hypothetical protein KPL70_016093 [Citrus sinensis]